MNKRQVLTELEKLYVEVEGFKWIDNKNRFLEFEIKDKGNGVYSTKLQKVILEPGPHSEIEIDEKMGWITFKKYPQSRHTIINYSGDEITPLPHY